MVSKIVHSSYVIDFLDVEFSSDKISVILKLETDQILDKLNLDSLMDWELQFKIVYGNKMPMRIFKKMPSYKNERQKLIVIHLPIPTKKNVPWGVESSQYITVGTHPNEDRYTTFIDVNFTDFNNRTDYILSSIRKGINFCFEDGFMVNGIKIKVKKNYLL